MYPKKTIERFVELFNAGLSYSEMAKELNVHRNTVMLWRVECGFPRRKRGPKHGVRRAG